MALGATLAVGGESGGEPPGAWHEEDHFHWVTGPEWRKSVSMTDKTRAFLESMLSEEQIEKTVEVLSHDEAWGALGPNAPAGPPRPEIPRPERTIKLEMPAPGVEHGSGTADDPWRGVLADFLADYDFEPHGMKAYWEYPNQQALDDYLAGLDYGTVAVVVPGGHYREWELDVPPGVWLVGTGSVRIEPEVPEDADETSGSLMTLHPGAGIYNLELNGEGIPGFFFDERAVPGKLEEYPEYRVNAVNMHHRAAVVECHIRNFTMSGISAAGGRGRKGSYGLVLGSMIENMGRSGISAQSRWLIQDNQLRHCGYLRPSGTGGDDTIIPRWGVETAIINNLVINGRDHQVGKQGRHVISGQSSHRCLVAGNVSISDGNMRNNIQFSDGSHENRFVGNLSIATGTGASNIQAGIGNNGHGSVIEYNVSLMNEQGFRGRRKEPKKRDELLVPHRRNYPRDPTSYFRYNYAEYRRALLHRYAHSHQVDEGNEGFRDRSSSARLTLTDPEAFGFFQCKNHE